MINRDTNASRGFGFVVFETSEAAAEALREMNGQVACDRLFAKKVTPTLHAEC